MRQEQTALIGSRRWQLRTRGSPGWGAHPTQVSGYENREVDQLAQAQLVTADPAQRRALVGRIQRLVANDLPVLPLYYSTL